MRTSYISFYVAVSSAYSDSGMWWPLISNLGKFNANFPDNPVFVRLNSFSVEHVCFKKLEALIKGFGTLLVSISYMFDTFMLSHCKNGLQYENVSNLLSRKSLLTETIVLLFMCQALSVVLVVNIKFLQLLVIHKNAKCFPDNRNSKLEKACAWS